MTNESRHSVARVSSLKPTEKQYGIKLTAYGRWPSLPTSLSSLFSNAPILRTEAGTILFEANDPGDGCYWVISGLLKVILQSERGEARILSLAPPGVVVGDISMIDGLPRSATIVAVTDSELRHVSQTAFRAFLEEHPDSFRYFTYLLAARLREADETIASLAFLTVKGRIAHALLELADILGEEMPQGPTLIRYMIQQKDLAELAGAARENVSRVLSEWRHQQVIARSPDGLLILDKSALESEVKI
jgi:CRP/FNR family cyclic AMP-dependent transcriptional regulator